MGGTDLDRGGVEFDREQRAIMYRKRALGPKTIVRKIDDAFCLPQGLPGEPVTESRCQISAAKKSWVYGV